MENNKTQDNKISDILKTSLENLRSMVDANTVIGSPINTGNGTVVIPVSKIMVGFASGGIDYAAKKVPENMKLPNNFGGGGGTGMTITPVAFLIVSPSGEVEMLNINQPAAAPSDPISQTIGLIERSPELVEKFKSVFSKNSQEKSEEKEN